jgi:hypothetical protein
MRSTSAGESSRTEAMGGQRSCCISSGDSRKERVTCERGGRGLNRGRPREWGNQRASRSWVKVEFGGRLVPRALHRPIAKRPRRPNAILKWTETIFPLCAPAAVVARGRGRKGRN